MTRHYHGPYNPPLNRMQDSALCTIPPLNADR